MNTSIVGIAVAILAVFFAIFLEGGAIGAFFKVSSLLLILGGTFGATFASYSLQEWKDCKNHFQQAMRLPKDMDLERVFLNFLEIARRDGILALEDEASKIQDPFLKKGIRLLVDGSDPRQIEEILSNLADEEETKELLSAKIFETMGGFSPTIGIIGTVLGLVHVLENLGAGTKALGEGIATAFIATFYGIAFANLLFFPIGNKLKSYSRKNAKKREGIIKGIVSLHTGENKRILLDRLDPYL